MFWFSLFASVTPRQYAPEEDNAKLWGAGAALAAESVEVAAQYTCGWCTRVCTCTENRKIDHEHTSSEAGWPAGRQAGRDGGK